MAPEHREKRESFRKWFQFFFSIVLIPIFGVALYLMDARTERTVRNMNFIDRVEWNSKWDAHDREVKVILEGLKDTLVAQSHRIDSLEANRDLLNQLAVKVGRVETAVEDVRENVKQLSIDIRQQKQN